MTIRHFGPLTFLVGMDMKTAPPSKGFVQGTESLRTS